jgi:hypothetical protein
MTAAAAEVTMDVLVQRIQQNAALIAGGLIAALNIFAVTGVWNPTGTTLAAINAAVAATLTFLVQTVPDLQARRVRLDYAEKARDEPLELVPTAGTIIDQIVGRDTLCESLAASLRERRGRPQVVVGDIGAGKTAVLVRLTQLLAGQGTIPVPIRLPPDDFDLDFETLAQEQFLSEVNADLLSAADGETTWRRLRRERKVCVLADGIDDVLAGEPERDSIIRDAIRKARRQHLPLVLVSRSYAPFGTTDAAILTLEPLSHEVALAYCDATPAQQDQRRLGWVLGRAEVVDAPVYMQVTRELDLKGLLWPAGPGDLVQTEDVDRARLRCALLETWCRAIIAGYLGDSAPLNRPERVAALEHASALACAGLRLGRREVRFDELRDEPVLAEVRRRLAAADQEAGRAAGVQYVDVRLAAEWAAELGLLEVRRSIVRFPHSEMQAYLGARLLDAAVRDPEYVRQAMEYPGPSREFLIALVFNSRAPGEHAAAAGFAQTLRRATGGRDDDKILDIYAAALELDSAAPVPEHAAIAAEIADRFPRIRAADPRTLSEAKVRLVRRLGEAAQVIDRRHRDGTCEATPAYTALFRIACTDRSYPVQLAAAREIGSGGEAAYAELGPRLRPGSGDAQEAVVSAWLTPMLVDSVHRAAGPDHPELARQARDDLVGWLRHVLPAAAGASATTEPSIALEVALAQGFRFAANRRPAPADREARLYLAEQAEEMLAGSRYWLAQLTLLHALCLFTMPGIDGADPRGSAPDPGLIVQRWVGRAAAGDARPNGRSRVHPLVAAAADLVGQALRTARPDQYCWIDERELIRQVGSRYRGTAEVPGRHGLWIPPSAGWAGLSGRAQQLLADVVLLMSLTDRDDQPEEADRRRRRADRTDLPPCLTHYRPVLEPGLITGSAVAAVAGASCIDGCVFELCPYPPKGDQPSWMELSEAFCRHQRELVGGRLSLRRATADWQMMRKAQLSRFWAEMTSRSQTGPRGLRIWR